MESKKNEFDNFDRFAKEYRDIHNENIKITGADSEYFAQYKVEIVAEYIFANEKVKLLDFGCGDGISLQLFHRMLPNAVLAGIDVSEDSIAEAAARNIPGAELKPFDGFTIPFADATFDIVFVANVFHHIDHKNHPSTVAEILRVLKPGGKLFIFEHNPYNPVTRQIVKDCIFDEDAVLLPPPYTKQLLKTTGFIKANNHFTLFFPRKKLFKPFLSLEKWLRWLPIGGQYYALAEK
jgi:SAM-dependent methyltransferase